MFQDVKEFQNYPNVQLDSSVLIMLRTAQRAIVPFHRRVLQKPTVEVALQLFYKLYTHCYDLIFIQGCNNAHQEL
nr:MAG: hypothetical protein EDM05_35560 [Leptolyngbya sp. IPPAS B-1204]RNJ64649.1 MAG: hypothetical protein EDM05_35385 [Leptolyngbya sp. IPPAS B-1204]